MNYDITKVKVSPDYMKQFEEIAEKASKKVPKELPNWAKDKILKMGGPSTDEVIKTITKPTNTAFKILTPTKLAKPLTTGQKAKCFLGKVVKMLIRK